MGNLKSNFKLNLFLGRKVWKPPGFDGIPSGNKANRLTSVQSWGFRAEMSFGAASMQRYPGGFGYGGLSMLKGKGLAAIFGFDCPSSALSVPPDCSLLLLSGVLGCSVEEVEQQLLGYVGDKSISLIPALSHPKTPRCWAELGSSCHSLPCPESLSSTPGSP